VEENALLRSGPILSASLVRNATLYYTGMVKTFLAILKFARKIIIEKV
jgi:hypothetical protein